MRTRTQFQPHLGGFKENKSPHNNMGGYLTLAKVIKVHHKRGTADVQLIKSNNVITSTSENEGKLAARICTPYAHFDQSSMTSSGVIEPLQEGCLVIIAYLDNSKSQPIIIGSLHNTWEDSNNILSSKYPLIKEDFKESLKYLRVFPSQSYLRVDGIGSLEYSHPSGTFLVIDPGSDTEVTDAHDGFGADDLSEKSCFSGKTLHSFSEDSAFSPSILLSQSCLDGGWNKMFFDRERRIRFSSNPNDGTLSYYALQDDSFTACRQLDTNTEDSKDYAKIEVTKEGGVLLHRVVNDSVTTMGISKEGELVSSVGDSRVSIDSTGNISLSHSSGSYIRFNQNGDIEIHASNRILSTEGHP